MSKYKNVLLIICFILLAFLAIMLLPDHSFEQGNTGKLYINEIMANNSYTIMDKDGDYSDYIELYNGYNRDINLEGYKLSDNELNPSKWVFPNIVIKKKSYLLIFASDKNNCNDECHTNFKLSSSGENLMLYDTSNNLISKISYEVTANDTSYGLIEKNYGYMDTPTPGIKNTGKLHSKGIIRDNSKVTIRINEYMTSNKRVIYDEDGDYVNWVELYNYGENDVNLKGFYLSDRIDEIGKYVFPDIILKKDSYLIVYTSTKNKEYDGNNNLHTNFNLSSKDSNLVLADNKGNIINKLKLVYLEDNISYGLLDDEWVYFATPTPNNKNNTAPLEKKTDVLKKKIVINEVSGIGSTEWIEIKNISDNTINVNNYKIYDKSKTVIKLPNINIMPNKFLMIYSSSNYSYNENRVYADFSINHDGEDLTLVNENNVVLDNFTSGRLVNNVTSGLNNEGKRVFFKNTTPNGENNSTYYLGYADIPSFSINGGYVEKNTKVYLNNNDKSEIYYTTDGSYPTTNSKKYENDGININKTMVIKAVSVKDNYLNSETISRTFIVGRRHNVAVVSLSTNYDNFFSNSSGILVNGYYNNYRRDWERPLSFEFYEEDGTLGIMFNGGTKLVGQDSREFPQKSLAIYLREQYGLQEITYPLFNNHDVTTFSSFTLRNSGEDVSYMKFKDVLLTETLRGQMDIDFQHYRAVVVYINGEYYGLYNIREKINESYLANNHGVDEDNIDLIKGNIDVKAGDMTNYYNLINYIKNNDITDSNVYEYVKSQVDVQELANYWVSQTYYRNTDTGNIRFWKERSSTGKWRWVLFDLDWAMYPTTYRSLNLFYPFLPYGHGFGNYFSTTLTYYLYKNSEFRDLYLTTFAYHLKNTFIPSRMIKIMDRLANEIRDEMPYHINRWKDEFSNRNIYGISSMNTWENRINTMKDVIKDRYQLVLNGIKSEFKLSDEEYNKYFGGIT